MRTGCASDISRKILAHHTGAGAFELYVTNSWDEYRANWTWNYGNILKLYAPKNGLEHVAIKTSVSAWKQPKRVACTSPSWAPCGSF